MGKKLEKSQIIKENARHEKDTGSTEVQVALITNRIAKLTDHLKIHDKDHHSRRGLFIMINKRRRLLKYLFRSNSDRYVALIAKLGIRSIVTRG